MVYLDTSAAIPLFIPEPASSAVDAWFEANHVPVVSADWILAEFASVLSIKLRSGTINAKQARAAWKEFDTFTAVALRLISVSRSAFRVAAEMTKDATNNLRAGDSLHLAVALEAGATDFATLDRVLADNAKARGLNANRF